MEVEVEMGRRCSAEILGCSTSHDREGCYKEVLGVTGIPAGHCHDEQVVVDCTAVA